MFKQIYKEKKCETRQFDVSYSTKARYIRLASRFLADNKDWFLNGKFNVFYCDETKQLKFEKDEYGSFNFKFGMLNYLI